MSRFLRRVALLGLLIALGAYLKQLLVESDSALEEASAPEAEPRSSATQTANRAAGSGSNRIGEASKADLYEQAQRLGIKGRSKMSKAQLERAIRET